MANRTQTGGRRWKLAALVSALAMTVGGVGIVSNALAVHGGIYPFELDGNVADPAGGDDDWAGIFGLTGVTPPATGTPTPSSNSVFIDDLPPTNQAGIPAGFESMYNAGKDTLDVTAWTRKNVGSVTPDKNNILNAYAKSYSLDHDSNAGTPNHTIIYFGADRLANNGDAALGFWFFQQKINLTGTNGFSPAHTARTASTRGDILVQVDFVGGGSSSEIQVFEWVGSFDADGNGSPGGNFGPLQELAFDTANGATVCANLGAIPDVACATTNNTQTGSFWPYVPKSGSSGFFPPESFFEGGIDLTAFAGNICINSFLANTRTSHSETADLKDLALGDFNTCGSIDLVRKHCKMPAGTVRPAYDPVADKFTTFHELTIRNDGGGGDIYDVSLRDDNVTAASTCSVTSITGGGTNKTATPFAIANNTTFYKLADALANGVANQMVVTLECKSPDNPFTNKATVRAGQSPGGTSLTDNYTEVAADLPANCVFDVAPSLDLSKSCAEPVSLDSYFVPKVCVNVTLTNSSNPAQTVDINTWIDDHKDGSSTDILSKQTGGVLALAAGDSVTYKDCYNPTAPDTPTTNPANITYGDTAKVTGTGRASGSDEASTLTVTCPLCPPPPTP
jgi:hypothetical protein